MEHCRETGGKNREEIILVGAGGHGLSLSEFSRDRIKGYLAGNSNPEMPGDWLGTDDESGPFISNGYKFHIAFVYSGFPLMGKRRHVIDEYEQKGAEFTSLISPKAIITPHSEIGNGCAIMTGAIINRAKLGAHVIVNSGAIVEHDCIIGDNTFIGPGAVIGGFTEIGQNCFIGLGARVGNGIKIADNVSIAMGAIVNRSLTEPGIYHGNPIRRSPVTER